MYSFYVKPASCASCFDDTTQDGSLGKEFFDIRDAITRANELCAPSSLICQITIYLYSGPHSIFNAYTKAYRAKYVDDYQGNINLTIQPLYCSKLNV